MQKESPGGDKHIALLFLQLHGARGHNKNHYKALDRSLEEIAASHHATYHAASYREAAMLFGYPSTHEDDAERAVFAAIDTRQAVLLNNEVHGTNMMLHCAIETICLGDDGSQEISAIITRKLAGPTNPFQDRKKEGIMVSDAIYQRTAYLFHYESIKSSKEPLRYRFLGVREKAGPKHGVRQLSSPLVGRKEEIRDLEEVLSCIYSGKAGALIISGEAGIGKSRFIKEFRKKTSGATTWLSGRCPSYERASSYRVFLEQIRSFLGVGDFQEQKNMAKILNGTAQNLFKLKKDSYLPYLSVFLSMKVLEQLEGKIRYLDPKSLRLQEFVSVKAFFRDLANKKPLILYFEDAQWIDSESLELLQFLFDGLTLVPILFLFEMRPDKSMGACTIQKEIKKHLAKHQQELRLSPLTEQETTTFIKCLLNMNHIPRRFSRLIYAKSEGNPFFIEELLRSLIHYGVLKRDNDSWKLAIQPSSLRVPDNIESVIGSRIDSLPSEMKEVLGCASVIGKRFPHNLLAALRGRNNPGKALHYLEDHGFIEKQNGELVQKSDTYYAFRHILIRDVAYHGLPLQKRENMHKQAAQWIEGTFEKNLEMHFEALAYHFDKGREPAQAYKYYLQAAEHARQNHQNSAAIEYYEKAIELHKRLCPNKKAHFLAELFEKIGDMKDVQAEYDEAINQYSNAFEFAPNKQQKSLIMAKIATIYRIKGASQQAISCYEQAIDLVKDRLESPAFFEILSHYEFLIDALNANLPSREKIVQRALSLLSTTEEPRNRGRLLDILGTIYRIAFDYDRSIAYFKESEIIYGELHDPIKRGQTSYNIGLCYQKKGELETALRYYKRFLSILKETDDRMSLGLVSGETGQLVYDMGNDKEAMKHFEQYLAISEEIGYRKGIGVASNAIGKIHFRRKKYDTALKYYEKYLAISKEISNKNGIAIASHNIGEVLAEKRQLDAALHHFETNLRIAEEMGYKKFQGISHDNIGAIYAMKGIYDKAHVHYTRCINLSHEAGSIRGEMSGYRNMAIILMYGGELHKSMQYLKKYLRLSRQVDCKTDIMKAHRFIGEAYTLGNRPLPATTHFKIAEKLSNELGDVSIQSSIYSCRSQMAMMQQNHEHSLLLAQKALALARKGKEKAEEAESLRMLGAALSSTNFQRAKRMLEKSIAVAEKYMIPFKAAVAQYELAKLLRKHGKPEEALEIAKRAQSFFKTSGLRNWITKTNTLKRNKPLLH